MSNPLPALVWHNEKRCVKDLMPYEGNPRILTEKQAEDLKQSLSRFNLVEVPAINTNNMICAGHQRLKILMLLGRGSEEIDVRVPNRPLTDEEFREYLIRSNKNTGQFDYDKLNNEWEQKKLMEYGFTKEELGGSSMPPVNVQDDECPEEVRVKVVTVPGDLYELKTDKVLLRLLCGDTENLDHVQKLMQGKLAQICCQDPPYNVDYESSGHHAEGRTDRAVKNDNLSREDFQKKLNDWCASTATALVEGGIHYMFMSSQEMESAMRACREAGFHWSSTIIWNKDRMVMTRKDFHAKYEPILYMWKDGAARIHPLETRSEVDVWNCDRPARSDDHPTQKPVELMSKMLTLSSNSGDLCIDFFNGSGSTGVACLKNGRNFCGMELEPIYVDVTLRRWHEWLHDANVGYTITRNGLPFDVPELFEASQDTATTKTN